MEPKTHDAAAQPGSLEQVTHFLESARALRDTDLDRARHDAQLGLELLRQLQTPEARHEDAEAELLVLLGSFDRLDGQLESAVTRCHAALKLIGGRPASPIACDAWISLGWAYAQIGDFSRALRYSLQGLKLARSQGERNRELHALDVLGCVYAIFGDTIEALQHLQQAERIARELGNRRRLCSILNNLAMTLLGKNELVPALAAGQESLGIARADSLAVTELNVVDTVAAILTAMGNLPEAEGCLVPAVSEAQKRPPNKALANLLGSLGMIRAASGDAVQAESLFTAELAIATQINDPILARQCHKRRAELFANTSRWQDAYVEFHQYHELNESIAGAKAAKRLTIVRIADEVDALHDAHDAGRSSALDATTVGALEALTARLRNQNRDLADAKREADAANETKSRFLANMSHELRTPLNGVLGMAQLLMRTPLDEKQSRYCDVIVKSGRALSDLVTDILDYTRLDTGRLLLETGEFEPEQLAAEVLACARPAASARMLSVACEIDERLPRLLVGDAKRIRQVLQHLVGNAVKFTQDGSVDIGIRSLGTRGDDARVWVRFVVRDTGIGIDPEAAAMLFKPFVQADDSATRHYGGSGLGLAISRHLVGLMGGSMDVHSELGKGSEFRFDIPLRPPQGAASVDR
jgi:signal transduction histidine kinase